MSEDWGTYLDFLYAKQGVAATLTLTDGTEVDGPVIDRRAGTEVLSDPGIMTLLPAAVVRAAGFEDDPELATLDGATLVFEEDETTWTVVSHQPRPFPGSALVGEILLMLERA